MAETFTGDPNATPVYVELPTSTAALMQRSTGTVAPNTSKAPGIAPYLEHGGIPLASPTNPFFGR